MNFSNSSHLSVVLGGALVFLVALAVLPTVLQQFNQSSVMMTEAGHCQLLGERFTTASIDWNNPETIFGVERNRTDESCLLDTAGSTYTYGSNTVDVLTPNGIVFATASGGGATVYTQGSAISLNDIRYLYGDVFNLFPERAVTLVSADFGSLLRSGADTGYHYLDASKYSWDASNRQCEDSSGNAFEAFSDVLTASASSSDAYHLFRVDSATAAGLSTTCRADPFSLDAEGVFTVGSATTFLLGARTNHPDTGYRLMYTSDYTWDSGTSSCLDTSSAPFTYIHQHPSGTALTSASTRLYPVRESLLTSGQCVMSDSANVGSTSFVPTGAQPYQVSVSGGASTLALASTAAWIGRSEILSQQPRLNSTIINMLPLVILVAGLLAAGGWIYNARRSSG